MSYPFRIAMARYKLALPEGIKDSQVCTIGIEMNGTFTVSLSLRALHRELEFNSHTILTQRQEFGSLLIFSSMFYILSMINWLTNKSHLKFSKDKANQYLFKALNTASVFLAEAFWVG